MKIRLVKTNSGTVSAIRSPSDRQTYVPLPTSAAGQSATVGANVKSVLAGNARATHVTS